MANMLNAIHADLGNSQLHFLRTVATEQPRT